MFSVFVWMAPNTWGSLSSKKSAQNISQMGAAYLQQGQDIVTTLKFTCK